MDISLPLICVGTAKRYRTKAIQTSKHCNIICMYTAFATTDRSPTKSISNRTKAQETGEHLWHLWGVFHDCFKRKKETTASSSSLESFLYMKNRKTLQLQILAGQIPTLSHLESCGNRRLLTVSPRDSKHIFKGKISLCSGMPSGNRRPARSSSHRQRVHSIGLGQRRTSGDSDDVEDAWNCAAGRGDLRDDWPCLLRRL